MPIESPSEYRLPREEADMGPSGFQMIAASLGLVLIGVGVLLAIMLFLQVYRVLMDPRPLTDPLNRWEFVMRGRTNDIPVRPVEQPDLAAADAAAQASDPEADPNDFSVTDGRRPQNEAEAFAEAVGRMGSKAARPLGLLVMLLLLGILVRVALGLIEIGGRLVSLVTGERQMLQRLVQELQRRNLKP